MKKQQDIYKQILEVLERKHPECFANPTTFKVDCIVIIRRLSGLFDELIAQERARLIGEIEKMTIGAIPETNDYANGWNACWKEYYQEKKSLIKLIKETK